MSIWKPEAYHGGKTPFFEGWYVKIADQSGDLMLTVIPGVFYGKNGKNNHAFMQIYDVPNDKYYYIEYPENEFKASKNKWDVQVGVNHIYSQGMCIDIDRPELKMKGEVWFEGHQEWPVKPLYPGTMGLAHFVPFLQCYYHVLSFNPVVNGEIVLNGQSFKFESGKGYIEKNWGREFPGVWLWFQSNHFDDPSVSIVVSKASVPIAGLATQGLLVGLYYHNQFFHWSSLRFHEIEHFKIEGDSFLLQVNSKRYGVRVSGKMGTFVLMKAPTVDNMISSCRESLKSEGHIIFYEITHTGRKTIYEGTTSHAGFELNGDINKIK